MHIVPVLIAYTAQKSVRIKFFARKTASFLMYILAENFAMIPASARLQKQKQWIFKNTKKRIFPYKKSGKAIPFRTFFIESFLGNHPLIESGFPVHGLSVP